MIGDAYAADPAAGGSQPHGGGYYRFSIGSMRATVISDGYGNVPFWPIFAVNQPASATEAFLKDYRLGPAPQFTNNLLVVDTPADRVLVDTGFGDVLGPSSGQFPWMVQNLERAGIPAESITLVIITHIHLNHVAGIVSKSGEHVFPRYVVDDDELTYWTGNRFEADVNASKAPEEFKKAAIYAAKTYLPAIRQRMQVVRPGVESDTRHHIYCRSRSFTRALSHPLQLWQCGAHSYGRCGSSRRFGTATPGVVHHFRF